jgi:hypothetical protein
VPTGGNEAFHRSWKLVLSQNSKLTIRLQSVQVRGFIHECDDEGEESLGRLEK